MRKDYSPINDLYGVEPDGRRSRQQSHAWLYIAIILAGLFFYESIHPVMHLRDTPPSGFVEVAANPGAAELGEQERVGRDYWELAIDSLQENYPFGTTLPINPPRDFILLGESDSGARIRYWNKLRKLWDRPEIWVKGYEWDTNWVKDALSSLRAIANKYLHA